MTSVKSSVLTHHTQHKDKDGGQTNGVSDPSDAMERLELVSSSELARLMIARGGRAKGGMIRELTFGSS